MDPGWLKQKAPSFMSVHMVTSTSHRFSEARSSLPLLPPMGLATTLTVRADREMEISSHLDWDPGLHKGLRNA